MRRFAIAALSATLSIAIAWAGAEVMYRTLSSPSYEPDLRLAPDEVLGWDSVPPVTALPANAPGHQAIVYVGDSFTQVAEWPRESQRVLQTEGVAANGFNLGVSGYGTTQEWLKLRQHIASLNPQAVVLLFFAWNDLRDNYPYPEIYYGPQRTSRPYLVMANGQPTLLPVRWSSSFESALMHSEAYLRLVNRAALAVDARIIGRWPDLPTSMGWRAKVYYEQAASWQPFYRASQARTAYVQGAYDTTIEAFKQIHAMTEARHTPLLVIGIDNSFTVDADDVRDFLKPNPDLDPSLPLQRMAQLLGAEGISFIDAQPQLAALGRTLGRDVYNGPTGGLAGHLGPEGDRLIGEIAGRWLATRVRQP